MPQIRWSVRRTRSGRDSVWEGTLEVPDRMGQTVKLAATAHEKEKALARSASIAEKALDNPALQALLPPGAAPALKTAAKVLRSKAARRAFGAVRRAL